MNALAPLPLSSPQAVLEAIDAELAALNVETLARGKELAVKGQTVLAYARQAKRLAVSKAAIAHQRISSLRKKLAGFGVAIETLDTGYRLDAASKARLRALISAMEE